MQIDQILPVVLAGIFFVSGATKLAGMKKVVDSFQAWGYAPSVRISGGVLEVSGAALLLVPDWTLYGTLVLLGVLGTALYTHLAREKMPRHAVGPSVLAVLVVLLGLMRGASTAGLGGLVFRAVFG